MPPTLDDLAATINQTEPTMSESTTAETEHPDVIALNRVYAVLNKRFSDQEAVDIISLIGNEGVVFRMAQWWIENYGQQSAARPEPVGAEPVTISRDMASDIHQAIDLSIPFWEETGLVDRAAMMAVRNYLLHALAGEKP